MYDPDDSPESAVLACINEVPKTFFRLSAAADRIHADLGVTGPSRGVLRALFLEGEHTAPDLAARKAVTRQSMQPLLDDLVAKGFVRAKDNPRHRRSKIYELTKAGIEVCVELQRRELAEIRKHLSEFSGPDYAAAAIALRAIAEAMQKTLAEEESVTA